MREPQAGITKKAAEENDLRLKGDHYFIWIKEKLLQRFKELELTNVDENRLEQELIFYLEKLDITEERVRLKQHINYFRNTMQENISIGKKIGFIAQEMGREINTLGSKSNEANMQQIVVMMKDELEKIKEQSANVL